MKVTFGQGLNADALSSELGDGFVSDCTNMRFRKGFAEVVGGTSATKATFAGGPPSWLGQLNYLAQTYIVGIGTTTGDAGAYRVLGPSTPDDITRKTEGVAITNATAAGTTVTITTTSAHGRSTGNVVSAWGFTPSTYNVESASITVTGATTFTYVVPSAPAVSPATAFGMYSRDALASSFSASATVTGGELNGVLLINNATDGLYYWAGDTTIPIRKVVGSYTARVGVPFGNYVIQLAPTIGGVQYLYRICWSNATEPGSVPHNGFTASTTNQAGDVDKPEIGQLVFAEPLGDDLIVYGTKGRLVMRYVGGNDVFSFTVLPGDEGLHNANCVASIPTGHVFVDRDRHVRIHSGGVTTDIGSGRVQSIIGADGLTVYGVVAHPRQSEVWIYVKPSNPSSPLTNASLALIWNWEEQTWGKSTITNKLYGIGVRTTSVDALQPLYFVGGTGTLSEHDSNENSALTASIERAGLDAGEASVIKNLQRSRWNLDNYSDFTPTHTIQHGSSMFADTTPTYQSAVTYTPGTTDWANSRATGGRFLAVKWNCTTTTGSTTTPYYGIRVRSADLDFTTGGKR
jgi:hypothetical protein